MNDSRNETKYQCVIGTQADVMDHDSTMTLQPTEWDNATILYVAGECRSAENNAHVMPCDNCCCMLLLVRI